MTSVILPMLEMVAIAIVALIATALFVRFGVRPVYALVYIPWASTTLTVCVFAQYLESVGLWLAALAMFALLFVAILLYPPRRTTLTEKEH
jgi:hypothetical protein